MKVTLRRSTKVSKGASVLSIRTRPQPSLRQLTPFADCTDRELELIDRLMTRIDLPKGRSLTREGRQGRESFIISDGNVRVSRQGRVLADLGAGEVLGERAILKDLPRDATAVTTAPTSVFVLAPREIRALYSRFPSVKVHFQSVDCLRG
jgi:CRP/FNR family cyclic AMP-dependent transcriptional regulator